MAGRIALDLKQFKHLKSDDKSTTLQHKDGHQLTIAHAPLSKEFKGQLQALGQSAKDTSKAIDKGESKQDAERMPDKKEQKGNATVHVDSTQKGIEQSKTLHKEKAAEHGTTIVKHDKDESKNEGHGKVTVRNEVQLAEGGDVPEALTPPEPQASPAQFQAMPAETQALQGQPEDPALARKRELYNLMVAGNPAKHPATEGQTQVFTPDGQAPQNFDPTDWSRAEQAFSTEQADNAGKTAALQQKTIADNQARTAAGLPALPVPNVPEGPQVPGSEMNPAPQQPNELPKEVTQPKGGLPDLNNIEGMMQSGYQSKLEGINQEAAAKGAMGTEQAAALNKMAQAQQDAQIAYKSNYDSLEKERQAHMADIKAAHIDPNKYWTGDKDGNGGHSKVMTGIGMILAGFNPTNSPNAAINFLKHQMDMNLQAQKENLGSEQNLLSANLRQFGNLRDATDMTRLMQHDIMQNELMSAAAKAQSPMAKAAALQAAGQLKMEAAPIFQNFAMRRAMMGLAQGSNGNPSDTAAAEQMIAYARMTNPEMAKEMESRLIPGVGMAKLPIPESARKEITEKQGLATAAQDLLTYSKRHSNLLPGTPDYNFGVTKALAFQQKVREGLLGTVFRESEKPLLEKFVNDNPAGAFKSLSTQPQLKAIIESNMMGLNAVKSSYGLPVPQAAPETKMVNGVKYMRGPNGKAIPVK